MANNLSRSFVPASMAVSGFWLWRSADDPVQVVAALVLALAAVVGVLWYSQVRRGRRWRTALDAYAERSLAQERQLSRRGAVLRGSRSARA